MEIAAWDRHESGGKGRPILQDSAACGRAGREVLREIPPLSRRAAPHTTETLRQFRQPLPVENGWGRSSRPPKVLDEFFQSDDVLRIRVQIVKPPVELRFLSVGQFRLPA